MLVATIWRNEMFENHVTVAEVARTLDVRPRDISDLFYQRVLDAKRCPIVGGRRLIPEDYVSVIEAALARRRAKKQ